MKYLFRKVFVLAAILGFCTAPWSQAAPFQEVGGQVVIEAEHFETRAHDLDGRHHWHIVPAEDGLDSFKDFGVTSENADPTLNNPGVIPGARGDAYIQATPASGQGKTTPADVGAPPYVTYLVKIDTVGSYRLWLRYGGLDGNSDVMYAEIVELRTDRGGPGPNWWRFRRVAGADFTNVPWDNRALVNDNGGGGNNADATWEIANPGTYTIRLTYREDGMMVDALILQLASLPAPANPGPPESVTVRGFVTVKTSPASQDGVVGGAVTFTGAFDASGPLSYQWQKAAAGNTNFTDIAGATAAAYTTPALAGADDGTRYRLKAILTSNAQIFATTDAATLNLDVIPPKIASVRGSPGFDLVRVTYDEAVDKTSAELSNNYRLSGGIVVGKATLINPTTVILATSKQPENTELTLTVSNVADDSPKRNVIAANSTAPFKTYNFSPGFMTVEFFEKWPGRTIETFLAGTANYPGLPDSIDFRTVFGTSADFRGEDFGARLRGFFVPQQTGDYVFFLAADDAGLLYLSADENPANKRLIAEDTGGARRAWTGGANRDAGAPQNRSDTFPLSPSPRAVARQNLWPTVDPATGGALIHLEAGKRYYMEASHKEGAGGDYLEVAAKLSADPDPANGSAELSGASIAAFTDPTGVSLTISNDLQDRTVSAGSRATFAPLVQVNPAGTPVFYQWRLNGQALAGATVSTYATDLLRPSDSGKKYSLVTTTLGGVSATTREATLTVPPDNTPPTITTTFASKTLMQVTIRFSEALDASASNTANYTLRTGGRSIAVATASATLDPNDRTRVVLTTEAYTAGTALQLTLSGLRDISGNGMTSTTITVGPPTKAILYVAGTIPPNAADTAAINHLMDDFNFEVFPIDDGVATAADADGKDLVIGASSSGSPQISSFAFAPQPVLFWEAAAEDDYLFTADADTARNTTAGQTQINVVNAAHPLAAGLAAGIQTVATTGQPFAWGVVTPPVQATVIATIVGNTNQAAIYVVQSGALLSDGATAAPARRVFFLLSDNAFTALNPTGRILFDAAVHYAMGIPYTTPGAAAPKLSVNARAGGIISISWDGTGGTLESANAITGPWATVAGASNPYTSSISSSQRFFRVRQ